MKTIILNIIITILLVFGVALGNEIKVPLKCHASKEWYTKLSLIKPKSIKLAEVEDCGDYININLYGTASDISDFMRAIFENGYGDPRFNTLDGGPETKSNMHIVLLKTEKSDSNH